MIYDSYSYSFLVAAQVSWRARVALYINNGITVNEVADVGHTYPGPESGGTGGPSG